MFSIWLPWWSCHQFPPSVSLAKAELLWNNGTQGTALLLSRKIRCSIAFESRMWKDLVILEPRFFGSIYMVENGWTWYVHFCIFFRIHLVCVCVFLFFIYVCAFCSVLTLAYIIARKTYQIWASMVFMLASESWVNLPLTKRTQKFSLKPSSGRRL